MPVLVTSAQQPLARRIARRLLEEGGEVRAYAHGDVSSLRAAGAVVASGEVDDEGRLEAAMAEVHTVVHVGGGLLTPSAEQIERDGEVVATAAENAGVARVVLLSVAGADFQAPDPLRRAKGRLEERFAAAGPPSVVLRTSLVDTPAVRDALVTSGLGSRHGDTEVAPVAVEDLVELVVAFDRARGQASEGHVVVAADGPRRLPLAAYLERVGSARPGAGDLVGRRLTDEADHPLLGPALTGEPWVSDDPRLLDGWRFAGISPGVPGDGDRPAADG